MMGCFLPCFGACKRHRKQIQSTNLTSSGDQTHVADRAPKSDEPTELKIVEEPITCIEISKINLEEKSNSNAEKKVISDFNSNTNEQLSGKELMKKLEEATEGQEKGREEETPQISEYPKSIASSKPSNTSHYRYRDYSDEGYEHFHLDEGDFCDNFTDVDPDNESLVEDEEDGEADQNLLQEESSGSLFSLSIDCNKPVSAAQKAENEVNSPMPLPGTVCYSTKSEEFGSGQITGDSLSTVLNPIENLAKATGIQALKEEAEENINTSKIKLKLEEKSNCVARKKVTFDLNVNTNEELSTKELFGEVIELSRPFNFSDYRYRDYCEEEYDDINLNEGDLDDPENDKKGEDEANWTESSESLFSVSIGSRKQDFAAEKEKDENEVNSPILKEKEAFGSRKITPGRDYGIQHVTSVLNPIENLMKPNVMRSLKNAEAKENIYIPITTPEPSLKVSNRKLRQKSEVKEIGVDTSLSSWLVQQEESTPKSNKSARNGTMGETTPPKGARGSPASHEDRPILGALTVEDLNKFSASSSPRRPRSRSRSPDEMPIIGTVGSYWSHTVQTMDYSDSNARRRSGELQGAKLKWNSTPFKARLERAFDASVADV